MYAEYVAKIKGDISALDKTIREAQGKIQRLNDDEVLIKFDYDGNAKQFNKVFQSIINKHPELTVQLQYDLNKKFLDQKMSELKELENLKMQMDPSDIEGELTDVNKKIEKTKATIEIINDEIKKLSSAHPDLNLGSELTKTQDGARETSESFEKVESSIEETHQALDALYDKFKMYFSMKGGKDVASFWEKLKSIIDAGDEELKELLADWKLLNKEGSLSTISTGGVNSGGLIGEENVLIARTNSSYKDGSNLYSKTNELKTKLDEAYKSGINVARILDIVGTKEDKVFLEIQEKAPGNILGSYGTWGDNTGSVNPEFFEATDEQIKKLIQDIIALNKLNIGVDINPENILYDKAKGFSFIDLEIGAATYKDQAELIEDILGGTIRTIQDFYEDLGNVSGLDSAQKFETRMVSIADAINNVNESTEKAIAQTQKSNSPSEEAKDLGKDFGQGYIEGIREKIPEVSTVASELAQAALDAVKVTQESDSPSEKTRKLGNDFGEGYVEGIKEKANEISKAAKDNVEEALTAMNNAVNEKFELSIIDSVNDIGKISEYAFNAQQTQELAKQANEAKILTQEAIKRTSAIGEQNSKLEEQKSILQGAAENAFKLDTNQDGNKQLMKMLSDNYGEVQKEVDRTVQSTQEHLQENIRLSKQFDAAINEYVDDIGRADINTKEMAESLQEAVNTSKKADAGSSLDLFSEMYQQLQYTKEAKEVISGLLDKIAKFDDADKYVDDFLAQVHLLQEQLRILSEQDIITPEQLSELQLASDNIQKLSKNDASKTFKELSRTKFLDQISQYLSKYTGLSQETRSAIEGIAVAMRKANSMGELKDLYDQFLNLKMGAREAGEEVQSMMTKIGNRLNDMNAKFIAQFFSIQDLIRYVRELAQNVVALDSALTELRKVSDATTERLQQSFEQSAQTAQELGSTISDVINITSDWARLGYNVDQAEELARVTTLFKTVGDNMTADDASSYLVSTMQGFQIAAEQAEDIVDKYNQVANNFAIDTAGIGQALQRSAASFNSANTSLSESIALITATNEVVQNPESVGTLWKTMSARIRGAKTELEDLNEETDEYTETTSKLRDLVMGLTGFDIMEDEETFKSIYDIILGIGEVWDDLTDIERASLGEALAGKRNANALYAVLGNLDTLQEAYKEAENSAESATREQENYAQSVQYSIDRFKASIEELSYDFLNSDLLKWAIELGNAIIRILDAIVENKAILALLSAGIIGGTYLKNKDKIISGLKELLGNLSSIIQATQLFTKTIDPATVSLSEFMVLLSNGGKIDSKTGLMSIPGALAKIPGPAKAAAAALVALTAVTVYAISKWDEYQTTVSEWNDKISETEGRISSLKGEVEQLQSIDFRNQDQQDRLDSLKAELDYEERLLEVEKQRANLQKYGTSTPAQLYDKENATNVWERYQAERIDSWGLFGNAQYNANNGQTYELASITKATEAIKEYNLQLKGVKDGTDEYVKVSENKRKAEEEAADAYQKLIIQTSDYKKELEAAKEAQKGFAADSNAYKSAESLIKSYTQWIGENEAAIEAYEKLVGKYDYSSIIDSMFSKTEFEDAKDYLVGLAKTGTLTVDSLKEMNNATIVKLITQLSEAGVEADELLGYLLRIAGLVDTDNLSQKVASQLGRKVYDEKGYEINPEAILDDFFNNELNEEGRKIAVGLELDLSTYDVYDYMDKVRDAVKKASEQNPVEIEATITDSVEGINKRLASQFKELSELYGGIFYGDKGFSLTDVSAEELKELKDSFLNLVDEDGKSIGVTFEEGEAAVNKFIDTLTSAETKSKSIAEQEKIVQQAFNDFATEYFYAADGLKELNEDTADTLKQMFKEMGIINADEIVNHFLHGFEEAKKKVEALYSEMDRLGEGGTVNLRLRPQVDSAEMEKAGWEAGEGAATVFTSTFENETGDVAINLTPIAVDENGNVTKILSPDELDAYAKKLLAGADDDLNLQIGMKFTGADALEKAVSAAERIHELQDVFYNLNLDSVFGDFGEEITAIWNDFESGAINGQQALERIKELTAEGFETEGLSYYAELIGLTNEQLADFLFKEQLINSAEIDTSQECAALLALAGDAKYTSEVYQKLLELLEIYSGIESGVYGQGTEDRAKALERANQIKKEIDTLLAEGVQVQPAEYKPKNTNKNRGGGSSSEKDSYVEAYKKEKEQLQSEREAGLIDESTYLDKLKALIDKFFKDRAKYAKNYIDEMKEYLEGVKSLYDSAISGVTTIIQKKIDAANKGKDAAVKALNEEKEAAEERYQAEIDAIQAQMDALDDLIEKKNDEKDAIQDQIDAINEANTARDRSLQLQKAEYDLQRSMNQRTKLVYTGEPGQMVYERDESSVRDARENLQDAQDQIAIAALEKQIKLIEDEIELLNKQKDALNDQQEGIQKMMESSSKYYEKLIKEQEKYWDSVVEGLEKQKTKWEELTEIETIANAYSAIKQVFGPLGYTVDEVINGSEAAFEDFKNKYILLMQEMNKGNQPFLEGLDYAANNAKGAFGEISSSAGDIKNALGEVANATAPLADAATNITNMGSAASTASSGMGSLKTATDGIASDVTELNNVKFDGLTKVLDDVKKDIEGISNLLIGPTDSIESALTKLNDETVLAQLGEAFDSLSNSIGNVASALGVGGGSNDQDAANTQPTGMDAEATGVAGAGLSKAIEEIKNAATTFIGESVDDEGETVIGRFNLLKSAIETITNDFIGNSEVEGTLLGNINSLLQVTNTALYGGDGAEGAIAAFDTFRESISACCEAASVLLMTIQQMGDLHLPSIEGGTEVSSGEYTGTAKYDGDWRVGKNEKSLVGELGPELVLRNGKAITVGADGPEVVQLKKDDIVLNHLQSQAVLDKKNQIRALADGTVLSPIGASETSEKLKGLVNGMLPSVGNIREIINNQTKEIQRTIEGISKVSTNPNITITNPSFTVSGVTGEEVMRKIEGSFEGLMLNAYQKAMS